MIDKGEGDRDQKARQKENLREAIKYCENRVDCRRKLILQYFNESFNPKDCNFSCDNCENPKKLINIDRTDESRNVVDLFKSINSRLTLNQLLDIFRGSKAKQFDKYKNLPRFGSGSHLSRVDTERLLQHLITEDVLADHCVSNAMGFLQTYLKVIFKLTF